jgi:hypothetical protein
MEDVRSGPSKGKVVMDKLGDPRYADGAWQKVERIFNLYNGERINIHFVRDVAKKLADDFKVKW